MLTDGSLISNSSRKFQNSNTANDEANRPSIVVTATTPTATLNGVGYTTLAEAWVKYYRTKNAGGETTSDTTDELGFGALMFGAEVTSTGIQDVRSKMEGVKGAYYNLSGQRIANPTKGLYIEDRVKVGRPEIQVEEGCCRKVREKRRGMRH